ncbi:hypothetical protein [Olleya marilimosa]|uniref:hypothetical protein n=1 Tax=Olleya marilimosa TaxID=272164 RepID=UPI0004859046|nr:hypothetical protein [Olleya marilimosa]
MKLTKEQIQYIDTYVEKSGIEWFDLKIELVDHLANATAQILEDNPKLPFEDAVTKAKIAFGTKGFKPLITNRTKQIEKSFYKRVFKYLLSFFSLPKIIITVALMYVLVSLYKVLENKENFLFSLVGVLFVFTILSFWWSYRRKTIDNKKHLSLSYMQSVSQFVNLLAQLFSLSLTLFKSSLIEGQGALWFIVLWVISFLFCIASEVVSRKIYKDQKSLYYQYKIL